MLCLICGEEVRRINPGEELSDSVHYWQILCKILEIEAEEYEDVLSVATYCRSCEVELLGIEIKVDPGITDGLEEERIEECRQSLMLKLMNSWMKLQSEYVHADNYCSWQSIRLRLLIELGAVLEVVEDPVKLSAEEMETDDSFYTFEYVQEDLASDLEESTTDFLEQLPLCLVEGADCTEEEQLYWAMRDRENERSKMESKSQIPSTLNINETFTMEYEEDPSVDVGFRCVTGIQTGGNTLVHEKCNDDQDAIPTTSTHVEKIGDSSGHSELTQPSQTLAKISSPPTAVAKSIIQDSTPFRLEVAEGPNAAPSSPSREQVLKVRISKRKPLRPTKGIYSLKSPDVSRSDDSLGMRDNSTDGTVGSQERAAASKILPSSSSNSPENNCKTIGSPIGHGFIQESNSSGFVTPSEQGDNTGDILQKVDLLSEDVSEARIHDNPEVDTIGNANKALTEKINETSSRTIEAIEVNRPRKKLEQRKIKKSGSLPIRSAKTKQKLSRSKKRQPSPVSKVSGSRDMENLKEPVEIPSSSRKRKEENHRNNKLEVEKNKALKRSSDSSPASHHVNKELPGDVSSSPPDESKSEFKNTRRSGRRVRRHSPYYNDSESSEEKSPRKSGSRRRDEQENSQKPKLKVKDRKGLSESSSPTGTDSTDDLNLIPAVDVKPSVLNSSNSQTIVKQVRGQGKLKFRCHRNGCDRKFSTKERRDNHFKRDHEGLRNMLSCHICKKSFPARTRLARHLERHEKAGKTYPCNECEKTFPTEKKLEFHLHQHAQDWGLYCDICNKGFPAGQEQRLANHKKIHDESRPRPFECETCKRKFSTQQYLDIHQKKHPIQPDDDGLYRCRMGTCQQTFKAVTSFREHQKIHTGELPFKCEVCGKRFGYITGYKKHMISHTDEKRHICHLCGQQFKQKGNLNLHIDRHSGVKPYKCTYRDCTYSFYDQYKLKNHMDVHTGKRRYNCTECQKSFRTTTGVKAHHAAVHAKERKYKCHCGKTFTQKQYLQFHKTKHPELNLKRFVCEHCSKKFSEPSSLREHMRRFHTKETAFSCDKCDYTACFKSRMDKHALTHNNPQFDCVTCGKKFKQANNLKRHITTVHQNRNAKE